MVEMGMDSGCVDVEGTVESLNAAAVRRFRTSSSAVRYKVRAMSGSRSEEGRRWALREPRKECIKARLVVKGKNANCHTTLEMSPVCPL